MAILAPFVHGLPVRLRRCEDTKGFRSNFFDCESFADRNIIFVGACICRGFGRFGVSGLQVTLRHCAGDRASGVRREGTALAHRWRNQTPKRGVRGSRLGRSQAKPRGAKRKWGREQHATPASLQTLVVS